MSRRSASPADLARRNLPHVVQLPERPLGWGHRLTELYAWCRANVPADRWFGIGGEFRFLEEGDAKAFAAEAGVEPSAEPDP